MWYRHGNTGRTPRKCNTVGANYAVAQAWARQLIPAGKSYNGNLWFDGPKLFSYEEPIGILTDAKDQDGKRVAILTSQTFSVTTSGKHERPARSVLRDEAWRVFYLPYIGADNASCEMNLREMLQRYDNVARELMHVRISSLSYYVQNTDPFALRHLEAPLVRRGKVVGSYPYVEQEGEAMQEHIRERLAGLYLTAWEFADAFALPKPRKDVGADVEHIMQVRREREVAYWHPTQVRQRLTKQARSFLQSIVH